jgi:lipopolysaccharide/colanic/teichoic acid biosynthesis glycosyltransferase
MLIIALIIKLDSKGPVIFKQKRIGREGKAFVCFKLRTMYVGAPNRSTAEFADAGKYITPIGRFLRRTSLDEIPQLLNVFTGEMALIGPRPIVEKEVAYYGSAYKVFSSVKPGITGLWQCSGRSDTDYPRRVALDSYYVLNWSPWLDI